MTVKSGGNGGRVSWDGSIGTLIDLGVTVVLTDTVTTILPPVASLSDSVNVIWIGIQTPGWASFISCVSYTDESVTIRGGVPLGTAMTDSILTIR